MPRGRPLTTEEQLARQVTGEQLGNDIVDLARMMGWLVHHDRPLRTKYGWRTGVQGSPGFPDYILVRDGEIHVWEGKREVGDEVTEEQQRWLDIFATIPGVVVRVVRPSDWPWIQSVLTAPRRRHG